MAINKRDLPAMTASSYASKVMDAGAMFEAARGEPNWAHLMPPQQAVRRVQGKDPFIDAVHTLMINKEDQPMAINRLVQVLIADTNDNLPLENRLLFKGEPQFTDATDQELFFELDIKAILEKHNEVRTKTLNKLVKDRTEYLEAAKVRDLKMVVVNIASF